MTDPTPFLPPCRRDATPDELAREADRAVLYGAILMAQRPKARIKPHIALAAQALVPAVASFLAGREDDDASFALAYARACGGEAFLRSKRAP